MYSFLAVPMPKILKEPTPAARTQRSAKPACKNPLIPAQVALLGTIKHADFVQFTPNGQLLLVDRKVAKTSNPCQPISLQP
jgi:hypothetical protein